MHASTRRRAPPAFLLLPEPALSGAPVDGFNGY
jgi:hypothetical protein